MDERRCPRCLLPDTVPGLGFDETGHCDICQVTPPPEELARLRQRLRQQMEEIIAAHRRDRGYECIVAYSGGKDSSYTLKLLVENYRLRCCAITVDNGFLSGRTLENCAAVCRCLSVDHVVFTPERGLVNLIYRTSAAREDVHSKAALRRASSICNSCINLINMHMLQKAQELNVPLIAGGYLAGQLPRQVSSMTIRPGAQARLRAPMVQRFVGFFGEEARPYFDLRPCAGDPSKEAEISIINPMLTVDVSEDEIIAALEPLDWVRPDDVGLTSTNCRLNDLGVYLHHQRHRFHPYAFEIAEQLRHGLLSRAEAEIKLRSIPTRGAVSWIADRIGLRLDDA